MKNYNIDFGIANRVTANDILNARLDEMAGDAGIPNGDAHVADRNDFKLQMRTTLARAYPQLFNGAEVNLAHDRPNFIRENNYRHCRIHFQQIQQKMLREQI